TYPRIVVREPSPASSCRLRRRFAEGATLDDAPRTAIGDAMHAPRREASRLGQIARQPDTGVVLVLSHTDVEALGRDSRMIGVGLGKLDAVGINDGPVRAWLGARMF